MRFVLARLNPLLAALMCIAGCASGPREELSARPTYLGEHQAWQLDDGSAYTEPLIARIATSPLEKLDLFDTVLEIERLSNPGIRSESGISEFNELVAKARVALKMDGQKRSSSSEALKVIFAVLKRWGLVVETDPRLSDFRKTAPQHLFHALLVSKRGFSDTISLLVVSIADRLGVESEIVCLPGHFLVRHAEGGEPRFYESTLFGAQRPIQYYKDIYLRDQSTYENHYLLGLDKRKLLAHWLYGYLRYLLLQPRFDRVRCRDVFRIWRKVLGPLCGNLLMLKAYILLRAGADPQTGLVANDRAIVRAREIVEPLVGEPNQFTLAVITLALIDRVRGKYTSAIKLIDKLISKNENSEIPDALYRSYFTLRALYGAGEFALTDKAEVRTALDLLRKPMRSGATEDERRAIKILEARLSER